MKGLVIDEPWISKILAGAKTWEMRSRHTSVRGQIALIRKGSGTIVGVADIQDCDGPLSPLELAVYEAHHQVPMSEYESGRASKWTVAWKLANVQELGTPVSYKHPHGAVTWVDLLPQTVDAVLSEA